MKLSNLIPIFLSIFSLSAWALNFSEGKDWYKNKSSSSPFGIDVQKVHKMGVTGKGVKIAVSDTGIVTEHQDLKDNFYKSGSKNFLVKYPYDGLPVTIKTNAQNSHGTSVAGIASGVKGIAPEATYGGFNFVLAGGNNVETMLMQTQGPFDIFNYSYGDMQYSFAPVDRYYNLRSVAYRQGTKNLRGKRGAIYVKAAGNEFMTSVKDERNSDVEYLQFGNSNFTSDNAHPELIIVGATNAKGKKASYSSPGSNLWIAAPGGEDGKIGPAITAPTFIGYTDLMNGTSAATPMISGVIALMLEANRDLTWRDVKHILASTAYLIDADERVYDHPLGSGFSHSKVYEYGWQKNKAGYYFHNYYGFGLVNAVAAVKMAKNYNVDLGVYQSLEYEINMPIAIADNGAPSSIEFFSNAKNFKVESVLLEMMLEHESIGDLKVEIVSPSGSKSIVINENSLFKKNGDGNGLEVHQVACSGDDRHIVLSNAFYGEEALGEWKVLISDNAEGFTGSLRNAKLIINGHNGDSSDSVQFENPKYRQFENNALSHNGVKSNVSRTAYANDVQKVNTEKKDDESQYRSRLKRDNSTYSTVSSQYYGKLQKLSDGKFSDNFKCFEKSKVDLPSGFDPALITHDVLNVCFDEVNVCLTYTDKNSICKVRDLEFEKELNAGNKKAVIIVLDNYRCMINDSDNTFSCWRYDSK